MYKMDTEENSNLIASQDFTSTDNNYAIEPVLVMYKTFSLISWISLAYYSLKACLELNSTYFLLPILNYLNS